MVLPDSHGVARAPWYSGIRSRSLLGFAYGGLTLFAEPFQVLLLPRRFVTPRHPCKDDHRTLQLPSSNACRLALVGFRLVPVRSPLLGESRLISFPAGTEMVQFPAFAHADRHDPVQVSPFGNPRVIACLPARRGLSQAPTSFIASERQGIHRVPFYT